MEDLINLKTKIAELQMQIQTLEKMSSLGVLSAGIAHEVKNPLNFVINFGQMANDMVDDLMDMLDDKDTSLAISEDEEIQKTVETLRSYLAKIAEHGHRATDIIDSILLYSRGKEDEFIPTQIQLLVKEYVWLCYHAMRANLSNFNVTIIESYDPDLPIMNIIPQDFCRAVLNVINNACYAVWKRQQTATDSYHPTLNIVLKKEADNMLLSIEDNGIGISEEVKKYIFTAFYTTKPAGEGTGLGLSITKDIIETKHKGHILIESEENVFTRFTFIIPISVK